MNLSKNWLVSKFDTFGDCNIELANKKIEKLENSANNPPRKAPKLSLSYVQPKKDSSTCFGLVDIDSLANMCCVENVCVNSCTDEVTMKMSSSSKKWTTSPRTCGMLHI